MLSSFDYHAPADLATACTLLDELPQAQVLAGGTDLLVDINSGLKLAEHVVSLKAIAALRSLTETAQGLEIGAACRVCELQQSSLVQNRFPELAEMIELFASPQVRNRATMGGNICSAVPCADFPVILIALGAEVELISVAGSRRLPLQDFFKGPRQTIRADNEILSRIFLPWKSPTAAGCYLKFQRRATNSLAIATVGAFLDIRDGRCHEARVVLGAVAPTPWSTVATRSALLDSELNGSVIERAAAIAASEARPITDVRGDEEFRRELIQVLTRRALNRTEIRIKAAGQ